MIFTAPNIITLNEPGTYLMHFDSLIRNTAASSGDVGASLLINGVVAPNASEYVSATTTETQISLQHSVTINDPANVTIQNLSTASNNYHDTSLSVIKLA